jgi:signal transduction histidine kinase/CheY-like chemotaxis protein
MKRLYGGEENVPAECAAVLDIVSQTYEQADIDRLMLERSLELSSEELGDANGQLRQAVAALQSAHREMEQRVMDRTRELEDAHARLRQTTKLEAIGQLAGGIAHDFNNLLTVIGGCTSLLQMSPHLRDSDQIELDEVRKATQRATALTQQLLAFSRRQVLESRVVDLNQLVAGLQQMLSRVIREDITLLVNPSAGPAWVSIDANQVEQAIINLVLNARDALPNGGYIHLQVAHAQPSAQERADAGLRQSGDYVKLLVRDNGTGMTPETRERIFEPFFTTKAAGQGTGLGLASVYGVVRQSNGAITVDTMPGVGSTFTILFPTGAAAKAAPEAGGAEARSQPSRETVLLVEDEDTVRRVVRGMLEQHGYRVIEAANPFTALEIFEQQKQDIRVLVTDVVMPGMNGPALAQRLVAAQPELNVLFVSGYADVDTSSLGLNHRHIGFLSKPLVAAQLSAKIRELFANA